MNDVSQGAGLKHAKQYLPFLTRGRVPAIVDFVMSGHRYKLYSPKEGVQVRLVPMNWPFVYYLLRDTQLLVHSLHSLPVASKLPIALNRPIRK